jgi:hypothetical protein
MHLFCSPLDWLQPPPPHPPLAYTARMATFLFFSLSIPSVCVASKGPVYFSLQEGPELEPFLMQGI